MSILETNINVYIYIIAHKNINILDDVFNWSVELWVHQGCCIQHLVNKAKSSKRWMRKIKWIQRESTEGKIQSVYHIF